MGFDIPADERKAYEEKGTSTQSILDLLNKMDKRLKTLEVKVDKIEKAKRRTAKSPSRAK